MIVDGLVSGSNARLELEEILELSMMWDSQVVGRDGLDLIPVIRFHP